MTRKTLKLKNRHLRYFFACLILLAGLVIFYLSQLTFASPNHKRATRRTRSIEGSVSTPSNKERQHLAGLSAGSRRSIFIHCSGHPPMLSPSFSVLLFTKTAGFRHSSIAEGIAAINALAQLHNFDVLASEDAAVFIDEQLALHQVVIFLNTTGDILDEAQQAALERFIQNDGGFVGIHSATDTEYDWPWYGQLIGTYFASHPAVQSATVQVLDPDHPSTQPLPKQWTRTDEWYNFQALPASTVTILAQVDESTYTGGTMGSPHPLVWAHEYDGGRAWYTAMGHTSESYTDPLFRQHLWGGILWAAGQQNDIYLPAFNRQAAP